MISVLSVVSYPFLPPKFGGQKAIALFYKYFSAHVQLTCITIQKNDPAAAQGYTVLNDLSNSPARYINIFYFFKLRKLIRQQGTTHLLIEHPYYGWLGILLKRFAGVSLIVRSHNIEGLRWKTLGKWWWKILWRYEKWVHRNADYNFFIQDQDLRYAVAQFGVKPERCLLMTYGIEGNTPPTPSERQTAREYLVRQHSIPAHHHILLFNGAFDYPPNLHALQSIVHDINPLLQQSDFPYTMLICGRNIPETFSQTTIPHLTIAGFVDDIDVYFKGSDLFLNPVIEGGGIKTKLVEALGAGMNAVSVQTGAEGIDPLLCDGKLVITADGDWTTFAQAVIQLARYQKTMPGNFYNYFYWGNIAQKAAAAISKP